MPTEDKPRFRLLQRLIVFKALRWGSAAALVMASLAVGATPSGEDLYLGRRPLLEADSPRQAQPCVNCHRPSGLGNFEGRLQVPPIAGRWLFQALDRATAHFFSPSAKWRIRPAYTDASLAKLLREGRTPDGVTLHPAMPRYAISDAQVAALSGYLRTLSIQSPRGIDDHQVRLATVITPDADPERAEAMVQVIQRFVERKNGQSRHEDQRMAQANRTGDMFMYRKYRHWDLSVWRLQGDPGTWEEQLQHLQGTRPVYALVAGMGAAQWSPVERFCDRTRLPCLLPQVTARELGARQWTLLFHAGLKADAQRAASWLQQRGVTQFAVQAAPPQAALVAPAVSALLSVGLTAARAAGPGVADVILAPCNHDWSPWAGRPANPVVWLPGLSACNSAEWRSFAEVMPQGLIVTPVDVGVLAANRLSRARAWLSSERLALPADVTGYTLQALTALGESLAHIDLNFTPAYVVELLEHNLENLVPWSPLPRLSLGPDQRIASKGSFVGESVGGSLTWRWEAATER